MQTTPMISWVQRLVGALGVLAVSEDIFSSRCGEVALLSLSRDRWSSPCIQYASTRQSPLPRVNNVAYQPIDSTVVPIRAGEGETRIPAASMAAILASASPLP